MPEQGGSGDCSRRPSGSSPGCPSKTGSASVGKRKVKLGSDDSLMMVKISIICHQRFMASDGFCFLLYNSVMMHTVDSLFYASTSTSFRDLAVFHQT